MTVRSSGPIAGLVMGALLTSGGWFVAYSIGKPIRDQAAASTGWPTADGRITRSQLARSISEGTTMYSADISYEYDVAGRRFDGDCVWFGDNSSTSDAAPYRRAVEQYAVGTEVKVHYDPDDPITSVLEPGVTWASSMLYFIGLGMLTVGGLILASALVPLLLIGVALVGVFAPRGHDPMSDFARPTSARRDSGSSDDDGITIG
ncbi:MAG: DUF3592 domain-containing protein [Pirellulales bacterium]